MQVEDGLSGVRADVRDDAVAALEARLARERAHGAEEAREEVAVGIGQVLDVGDVAARDDEQRY